MNFLFKHCKNYKTMCHPSDLLSDILYEAFDEGDVKMAIEIGGEGCGGLRIGYRRNMRLKVFSSFCFFIQYL